MDSASKRQIEELTARLAALSSAFQQSQRPKQTSWVQNGRRRNWVGFLYASYRGSTIGFWVVPSFALDGELPSGVQWVVNLYKWNFGLAGATIRVEEDPENDRWIPLQQEYICDDGRTIAEPPAPPPADPPIYP